MKPYKRRPVRDPDLVYGARTVLEALEAGRPIDKIVLKKGLNSELRQDVADLAAQTGTPIQYVPVEAFNRLAPGVNHQGVIAYASVIEYVDLEQLLLQLQDKGQAALFVMLDGVTDVRNIGAIARSVECMGGHGLIIPRERAGRINADAVKISAGALSHLSVCRPHDLRDAAMVLQSYGVQIVAFSEKTENSLFDIDFRGPVCLLLGAEDKGIQPGLLKRADHIAAIPMTGKTASLNVSVSAGMALLEVARQRG